MKIFLGGDVCPTDLTEQPLVTGDIQTVFGDVCELVKNADCFVINLECALTTSDTPIKKWGPNLRANPECAKALRTLGVTDVGISNNHVYDYGHQGFVDTLHALQTAGLSYTGVGANEQAARKPHFMHVCGKTVALVAVSDREYCYALPNREGCWAFDAFETIEDIQLARKQSDFLVVMYHGGNEQSPFPSRRLRKACQAMVRAGADLVLCQHSHCIGLQESYKGKTIIYGQGNFNFLRNVEHPHWQVGLLLEVDFDDQMQPHYNYHPVKIQSHGIVLCHGEEKDLILQDFYERSEILLDEEAWLAQWHAYCVQEAWRYEAAIAKAYTTGEQCPHEVFRHYLDTDAHSDVWKELYPTWNGNNMIEVR